MPRGVRSLIIRFLKRDDLEATHFPVVADEGGVNANFECLLTEAIYPRKCWSFNLAVPLQFITPYLYRMEWLK